MSGHFFKTFLLSCPFPVLIRHIYYNILYPYILISQNWQAGNYVSFLLWVWILLNSSLYINMCSCLFLVVFNLTKYKISFLLCLMIFAWESTSSDITIAISVSFVHTQRSLLPICLFSVFWHHFALFASHKHQHTAGLLFFFQSSLLPIWKFVCIYFCVVNKLFFKKIIIDSNAIIWNITETSCVYFIQFPPMVTSYITVALYYTQEIDIDTIYRPYSNFMFYMHLPVLVLCNFLYRLCDYHIAKI